jgi:hypothetical protein
MYNTKDDQKKNREQQKLKNKIADKELQNGNKQ